MAHALLDSTLNLLDSLIAFDTRIPKRISH
jgi:hypothetical protein